MDKRLITKLAVDLAMTVLMVFAMAYQFTGNLFHEIIGVSLFILFIAHNLLNRKWYAALLKGRYSLSRTLNTTANMLLMFLMSAVAVSGILLSRDLFSSVTVGGDMLVRRIHTTAAHWGFLLIGIHLGMHWIMILGGMRKMARITDTSTTRTWVLRLAGAAVVVVGVKASFDHNIGAQLIAYFTFGFRDSSQPAIMYLTEFLCILGLYAAVAHYMSLIIRRREQQKNGESQ